MSYDFVFNYILIGDTGVGKSCLLLNFIDKGFRKEHLVTIGVDFGSKIVDVKGIKYKLLIWDTAGQETFNSISRSYYRNAVGGLLVYDITNKESFQNVKKWLENVKEFSKSPVSLVLVGNKTDLESERVVSKEEGEAFAKEHGLPFIETSAKQSANVDEAFFKTIESICEKMNQGVIEPKKTLSMTIETFKPFSAPHESPKKNCLC